MIDLIGDILYEDNQVLVAVKPPNMLSQADRTGDPDILSVLKNYIKEKYHKPGNVYLGLVHRLDQPVGGLMVFARTSKAAEHDIGRQYLCVVTGDVPDEFTLTDYLIHDEIKNREVVCEADEKGGKMAILHGRCIDRRNGTALCAIRLETGRKHQIRAQMSNIGAPLWGGIWDTYADLLTIPEDTDLPKERPALVLREEVVQKLEEFDKFKEIKTDELL